jgi:hypothetical protein
MSTLTLQQALEQLRTQPDQFNSVQALYDLAKQVNVNASGNVTILYSGQPANGVVTQQIIDAMKQNGESIRVIDDTDSAKFLNSKEFKDALASQYGLDSRDLEAKPSELPSAKQAAMKSMNDALYDATKGPWAEASARFVDATVGEVRTFTGGANAERVFGQTEIPHALNNPNITSIDGIPLSDLKKLGATDAFKAISAASDAYTSQIKVLTNPDGSIYKDVNGQTRIDSRGYFEATGLEGKPPIV